MSEKEEGEMLAGLALDAGVPVSQLRKLYDISKQPSMSIDGIETFVKYQMPRVSGYWDFGNGMLPILNKYRDNKGTFLRVLEYTIMLYEYLDLKRFMDLKPKVSGIVERICKRYGFENVEFSVERGKKRITVVLSRFRDDPRSYSSEIHRQIRSSLPEASKHKFGVWIEKRR